MNRKEAAKTLGVDNIACIDFETYYDKDYSLKKMATTEYIIDPRFELQTASVQMMTWSKPRTFVGKAEFVKWARTVDWSRTGFLAHHCQFDGLIASHHCGIQAGAYLDTLSMARPLMPITVGGSLKKLTESFGRPGKRHGSALVAVMGRRLKDFTKDELRNLREYNSDDVEDTWFVFDKLVQYLPLRELAVIDATMKMYTLPVLRSDRELLMAMHKRIVENKQGLLTSLGVDKKDLMSNDKFAELLLEVGVEPPMKISAKTNKPTYAFSKQDEEFKALLEHDDENVVALVEARLGIKSTIAETRALRMANRSYIGAQPVYLNYAKARTLRWSGGDKINWQNMTRGSDLRKSIKAPPGHVLVIADQAQIEARLNAWYAGQQNIVDAFASGADVYAVAASGIYGFNVDRHKHPNERFVGKVATLALGYQAGGAKFAMMLRLGAFGPPVKITDKEASDIVAAWRRANSMIVANWKRTHNNVRSAFGGLQSVEAGCITYEGRKGLGLVHLPNGTYMRYDRMAVDENGDISYAEEVRRGKDGAEKETRKRLYGGLETENNCQALGRAIIADNAVDILREFKNIRLAMTTHDELVFVVPFRSRNKVLQGIKEIMTTAPSWAKGLPLGVDAHISSVYDK